MNSVNVIGRLVREPELRHTASGLEVANFRIAVDGAGEKGDDGKYGAGFFNVAAFGKSATLVMDYVGKGRQVGISGRLSFREYTPKDSDTKRQVVEIIADRVSLIGSRDDNAGSSGDFVPAGAREDAAPANVDDDIPF